MHTVDRSVAPSADPFVDLICNDPDLLRAEFDAIVADEWPGPPERPPHRREPHWQERRTPRRSDPDGSPPVGAMTTPGRTDTSAWERSPPHRN